MPPRINGDADQMYWVLSRSDTFTVKSAYMFVAPSVPSENTHIWNIIWRWKSTQRVCTFMWLIVHNRLKTHWELYRRHIVDVQNELLEMWTRCGGCFACSTWFLICKNGMGGFGSIKLSTCFFLLACMWLACVQHAKCLAHWSPFGLVIYIRVATSKLWYWRNKFIRDTISSGTTNMVQDILNHCE